MRLLAAFVCDLVSMFRDFGRDIASALRDIGRDFVGSFEDAAYLRREARRLGVPPIPVEHLRSLVDREGRS